MTQPETPEEVREQTEILHTGRWYIAELEDPQLAVQGESEQDARQKMVKRWREYTEDSGIDAEDIMMGSRETDMSRFDSRVDLSWISDLPE